MTRAVLRIRGKKLLTVSFAALGPLGNILTPSFFPESFRAYYFVLPLFPLFFFHLREKFAKVGAFFLPFFIFCYVSAFIVEKFGEANEPHTIFRLFLLLCQFFFVIGAASSLRTREEIFSILKTYLSFFFISVTIGYVFFIGFYLGIIPLEFISRFSVLTQFSYNHLRFSPGSYPNEYGIVCSFVLTILILIFFENKTKEFNFSKYSCVFFSLFTFLAFLLTTTRAAYLSFLVSVIYLTWKSRFFIKAMGFFAFIIMLIFYFLSLFKFNMFQILSAGFSQKIDEGSLGDRYFTWIETIERAKDSLFWGTGFASLTHVHNVYLQLTLELGFVGMVLLLGSLFIALIESFFKYKKPIIDETSLFVSKIRMVGLINVLSFAASNHNLNHHLTWFVCFLCFSALRLPFLNARSKQI
jgi:O-antigen ligase